MKKLLKLALSVLAVMTTASPAFGASSQTDPNKIFVIVKNSDGTYDVDSAAMAEWFNQVDSTDRNRGKRYFLTPAKNAKTFALESASFRAHYPMYELLSEFALRAPSAAVLCGLTATNPGIMMNSKWAWNLCGSHAVELGLNMAELNHRASTVPTPQISEAIFKTIESKEISADELKKLAQGGGAK